MSEGPHRAPTRGQLAVVEGGSASSPARPTGPVAAAGRSSDRPPGRGEALRILHVLDHSIPLHSGYTFRTLSILREQRRLGFETFHLTSPKHTDGDGDDERVDGWHFYRTPPASASARCLPGSAKSR